MHRTRLFFSFVALLSFVASASSGQVSAPRQPASIVGTVTDTDGALIPGATVKVTGLAAADTRSSTANTDGSFAVNNLPPASTLHLVVSASGFADWTSPEIVLTPGQLLDLHSIQLTVAAVVTSVSAATVEEVAVEQMHAEEQQRVLGIMPNFYVVYDHRFVPLTPKLKFQLARRSSTDVVTFAASGMLAGIDQASGISPHYVQGMTGFGERYGAAYTGSFSDIMIGGAILPSLLHQDPRYFYQGTGSRKSRALHAIEAPFIAKGDEGRWEPNYSSIGGDFASSALTNLYYPRRDRGPGLVFRGALEITGGRIVNTLAQEFLYSRFTSRAKAATF